MLRSTWLHPFLLTDCHNAGLLKESASTINRWFDQQEAVGGWLLLASFSLYLMKFGTGTGIPQHWLAKG